MIQSFCLILSIWSHVFASPRFFLPYRKSFFPSTLLRNVWKKQHFSIMNMERFPGSSADGPRAGRVLLVVWPALSSLGLSVFFVRKSILYHITEDEIARLACTVSLSLLYH